MKSRESILINLRAHEASLINQMQKPSARDTKPKLEIVLKCDSAGSVDAVRHALSEMALPNVDIHVIQSGIGPVTKSDVLLAETAGRLIICFQVDVLPNVDRLLREHNVEVRLYEVIYTLTDDVRAVAEGMVPPSPEEQLIGSANVIALFKSERKGIIIGCEVVRGFLAIGEQFRIISAMGPVYSGTIESMHIRENAVQKATSGQQVGIKIRNFDRAKVGDMVESFRPLRQKKVRTWQPRGEIIRKR